MGQNQCENTFFFHGSFFSKPSFAAVADLVICVYTPTVSHLKPSDVPFHFHVFFLILEKKKKQPLNVSPALLVSPLHKRQVVGNKLITVGSAVPGAHLQACYEVLFHPY